MSLNASLASTIDWFIPDALLGDREMRTRARMFLFSHMFGPILGNVIPGLLLFADPRSAPTLAVLAGSICCFWFFPFLLKYTGKYNLLSYLSIQNLLFSILWGCYFYGDLSSPFLPWLVTVPLLAFFYLGASVRSCVQILLQIAVNLTLFVVQFVVWGTPTSSIKVGNMQMIGLVSIISAAIYVSMMALYYAKILASQSEFEKEVQKHIETSDLLRAATAQAERANAAKADFLAKMSHELRTPLNAVIGYSQILIEDTDARIDPQGAGDLNKIHDAGHHLLRLVNAILDLSKIEAGKMESFPAPVEFEHLLQGLVRRWREDRRMQCRSIRWTADGPIGVVKLDSAKLEQILNSLIENAVRYAPKSAIDLQVKALRKSGKCESLEIIVRDEGPGIPEALLPVVFDTFSDLYEDKANKNSGPGLGLPLAFRLSNLIGGALSVLESNSKGTALLVRLDLRSCAPVAVEPDGDALARAA